VITTCLLLATLARASDLLTPADFRDAKRWDAIEGSPAAEPATVDGKPAVRLRCPFSTLETWRAGWDVEMTPDLTGDRWITVRVKADDPEAVAVIVLYFESGAGWYRSGVGGVGRTWRTLKLPRAAFGTEGTPAGWNSIRRVRIAVTPAAKRDVTVTLAALAGTSALAVDDVVRIGPWQGVAEVGAAFKADRALAPAWDAAEGLLRRAAKARNLEAKEPQALLAQARGILVEAYARAQTPKPGEFRAGWCHSGDAYGMGWPKVVDALAASGFNAVFPNMLWSGVAYYPSSVVPVAKVVAEKGDQLKILLDAAHAKGIQVHVWKVCFQMGWMADPAVAVPYRFAGRMMVDKDGKQGEWLCPSNAANRKYELDAIRELVSKYPIDGFQLDYIRYPGDEWCFCPTCRANFEEGLGVRLDGWPKPVLEGGKYAAQYADWRRGVITSFVLTVRQMMKDVRPEAKLSAAVFSLPASCRNSVFQDWGRWIKDGLVDFVCPMNYTESLPEMRSAMKAELEAAAGKVPVYAGLYATYGADRNQAPDMAVAQIAAARELGASGFILFELQEQVLRDLLPVLRLGVTSK
jgi:uncharacterized lipoprotein YddW (UPF0748 family)